MTVDEIITQIIDREGREYSDRPADRGGPTKFGVTKATLSEYRLKPCTDDDVKDMDESEARAIYRFLYVITPGFHKIANDKLQSLLVDSAVQHGAMTAIKFLQQALSVGSDGKLGPITINSANAASQGPLYLAVYAIRQCFYGSIIAHDPELRKAVGDGGYVKLQAQNALGWANRQTQFLKDVPT